MNSVAYWWYIQTEKKVKNVWGVTGTKSSGDGSNWLSSPDRALSRWVPLELPNESGSFFIMSLSSTSISEVLQELEDGHDDGLITMCSGTRHGWPIDFQKSAQHLRHSNNISVKFWKIEPIHQLLEIELIKLI